MIERRQTERRTQTRGYTEERRQSDRPPHTGMDRRAFHRRVRDRRIRERRSESAMSDLQSPPGLPISPL
jgi:hypothetical protein